MIQQNKFTIRKGRIYFTIDNKKLLPDDLLSVQKIKKPS